MQRWQLTTGLATLAALAALLVPNIPGLLGPTTTPPATPQPPTPPATPDTPDSAGTGLLRLDAQLDQKAILRGTGDDRFLVVEVSAPDLPGDVRRSVHVAVAMDVSGSMAGRGKMTNARMAASELVDLLQPGDTFTLVTFSDRASVKVPTEGVEDTTRLHRLIESVAPGGGTNLYDGLNQAMAELQRDDLSGVKRVVLLSDGQANIGVTDAPSLARTAGSMVSQGISVSAMGLGLEYNEDLLTAMSDAGGGTYRFVDRPGTLSQMFAQELRQMTAIAGREATVQVQVPHGVQVLEVYGYDADITRDGYRVFLGDVHGGETRKVVARVRVPDTSAGTVAVADVQLRYADADSGAPAEAQASVTARVTEDQATARASVNKPAATKAVRARAGKLLDEGTRAWSSGDMATSQTRLAEGEALMRDLGYDLQDDSLIEEAKGFAAQQAAFGAASPSTEEGVYQVKKAKEQARESSRR